MKKIITILIFLISFGSIAQIDIKDTFRYKVLVDEVEVSVHINKSNALETYLNQLHLNPSANVEIISTGKIYADVGNIFNAIKATDSITIFERDTIRKAVVLATPSETYNKPGNMLVLLYGDGQSFTSMTDSASIEYADEHQPVYFRLKETVHQFGDSTYIVKSKRLFPDYVRMAGPPETVIDSNRIRLREFYTKQCQITKLEYRIFGSNNTIWTNVPTPLGFSASRKKWNRFAHGRWIEGLKPETTYVIREHIETTDGETLISPARVLKTLPL